MKRHFYKQLKFFLFLSLMSFITLSNSLFAQDKGEIKGRVTNAVTGEELIGANVFIPALNTGASTDVNGYFTIKNISPGTYVLTAQYVGYSKKTYEIIVRTNSTTQQDFALDPTSVQMDEVVVTGQGTATEKRKLTTTIETINTEEIRNAPVESVDQLLQGRVTGLESFNSSGLPGTSGRITTRGVKSSNTSTTPVIYVDGVRVDNSSAYRIGVDMGGNEMSALSDLIVGEIDRIEVIKGGAASTIYGSEAANGVIQIFTKKGIPGPPKWTFNVTSGYDKPEEKFIMEDVTKQLVMHAGRFQSYSLGVQGGSKDFTYSFNGKILENLGIIIHDNAMNRQYSLSSGFRVLFSEKTNLDMSASYVKTKNWGVQSNNTIMAPYSLAEVYDWIWYTDPSDVTWEDTLNTLRNMFENYSMAQELVDDVDRFRLAANFEYKPFENFINRFTFGVDYRRNEQRNLIPKHAGDFWYNPNGYLERYDRAYATWTLGYSGSYKLPELGPVAQTITFGAQGFRVEDRQGYMFGDQFNIPGTDDIGNTATQTSDESNQELFNGGFYLTDQIGFWDRVFVDLGFRVDANSTFGDNVDLVFYPKVGIAYNVSDESFYPAELKPIISTFKLRAAVGQTGNFPAPFTRDRTYSALQFLGSSGIG
ncbi:MAG: TonB-dependent receptor, partial [Ignavibacteriales bacterium]|nr:TonB-dependent receptor [Ignavibacteriales bacterium]